MATATETAPAIDREATIERIKILEELERRRLRRQLHSYYPDTGERRRELYGKHLEFFKAGSSYRERLLLAANRSGKSTAGAYESALHLTGLYPSWWQGKRYDRPVVCWAVGTTGETTRDIVQAKLMGFPGQWGTGMIPGESVKRIVKASGIPDAIDLCYVQHSSGGVSTLAFKSYKQGPLAFQGTGVDVVWEDEEPPMDVHAECLIRTMTVDGIVLITFTPLLGMSEVVLSFLPGGDYGKLGEISSSKYVVMATWDDAPHLSERAKAEMLVSTPIHQRDARSKGVPQLGSGAIYPIHEDEVKAAPISIPTHWPRGYGMDVGWNCTAAVLGAWDREGQVLYLTNEYWRGQAEPVVHAAGVKAWGDWIPGFIDPASNGRNQKDGSQLLSDYRKSPLNLKLQIADNGVESGIQEVFNMLSTGRLKVFSTMTKWFEEYRLYRRDEHGKVVKQRDHLMDATRYLVSRMNQMTTKPIPRPAAVPYQPRPWA